MNNLGEEKQLSKLRLILAINDLRYFFSHRKKIAEHFSEQGGKVTVVFLKNSLSSEYTQSSNIRILPLFSSEFLRVFVDFLSINSDNPGKISAFSTLLHSVQYCC